MLKLGVNIDHVATLRQARYAMLPDSHNAEPDLLAAAREAEAAGCDSITIHLRADRRHIQDADVAHLREHLVVPMNLELGNTPEIVKIALDSQPAYACLVPENREEITTEGGLDAVAQSEDLRPTIDALQDNGTDVSLFLDPEPAQIEAAADLGARMIELHTGAFSNALGPARESELARLKQGAVQAHDLGLQVNAGHGINTENIRQLFAIPHLAEFNIGHHLVSRAITTGLRKAVTEIREIMREYPG